MKYFLKYYCGAWVYLFLLPAYIACSQPESAANTELHYQLTAPIIHTMPESLSEISGIASLLGRANTFYAVQDEDGKIYMVDVAAETTTSYTFNKDGDYEDISIFKEWIYVLKSDGVLFRMNKNLKDDTDRLASFEIKNMVPEGEYEGLYINEADSIIYLLCKHCKTAENKKDKGLIYRLKITNDNRLEKMQEVIYEINDNKAHNWHPAAMSKHPLMGNWFILSSVNNILCVYDTDWQWKASYPLHPSVFNQPEGICFNAAGDMFISNEGSKTKKGNILFFKYE